ncbi:MAG: alpha-L-arabinofuranosidase C-terminal domain-containing protein [Armatimonas sp.]
MNTLLIASWLLAAPQSDTHITISPSKVVNRITPYMYGSCIEDVNHEIYGGLYAQRIFGESFEEPPLSPFADWNAYGGNWRFDSGALQVDPDAGAKLVRQAPLLENGTVEVDMRFPDTTGEIAGLILRVSNPRTGADSWNGYEISLNLRNRTLLLGRHRYDWEALRTVPAPLEVGRWHHLKVELQNATLRVFLDDSPTPLLEHTDASPLVGPGLVGLRTWNSRAEFRRLTVTTGGKTTTDALDQPGSATQTVSSLWDPIVTGSADANFTWDGPLTFGRKTAYNSAHFQQFSHSGGGGTVGIANRGLNRWGISVRKSQPMQGHFYADAVGAMNSTVTVALQSADGARTYAKLRIPLTENNAWKRYDFQLTPTETDANSRFVILLEQPGNVKVDQVYLSDTGKALFGGGPFRADIGNMLKAQGLTFLRYGGTMVNAPEYRWKKMIGDRDKRPQYRGHWYPHSTNGFGIEEFLQFCESAKIEPAFAINIDETPEDAADLVEYLNGPATSTWGAKRAANGHPKPYNVRYIQIGNEEGLDGNPDWYRRYLERFKILYAAMRPRDSRINYVIAAWWNPDQPICKQIAQELGDKAALWDLHVGGDNLRDADGVDRTLTQMKRLFAEWIPGSPMKVAIFEENGNRHDFQRALGHARILNVTQRHGDFVLMDCPANGLQPLGQNDNGWDQGQIFFLPNTVWGMPPYYAQQMAAQNHLPVRVASETISPNGDLDVTATKSEDGKTLVLKIVNSGATVHRATLNLGEFIPVTSAEVWTLIENLQTVNTPGAPDLVRPSRSKLAVSDSTFEYAFKGQSYTILRFRKR